MEKEKILFTSESVTEGHPDKIADQISDAVLDAILAQDPKGRVACETIVTTGQVHIFGEISTQCYVDIAHIARETINNIGYNRAKFGFDGNTCGVLISIDEQSPDIAMGVDKALEAKEGQAAEEETGAGDQGMMFGYATNETESYMPMPAYLANKLALQLTKVRKEGVLPYLRPDGKTQVTIEYENDVPVAVETIVISNQHSPEVEMGQIRADIKKHVIDAIVPKELMNDQTKIFINPTGRFVIGGPQGDSGLTGRKIIVDTYGGMGRHGGGAFSGKVDRSAAYAARYVAKNIVAAKLAKRCEVQLAYAIGVAKPVSINVNTFGTGVVADEVLEQAVEQIFDLRPTAIIKTLDLPSAGSLRPHGQRGPGCQLGKNRQSTGSAGCHQGIKKSEGDKDSLVSFFLFGYFMQECAAALWRISIVKIIAEIYNDIINVLSKRCGG